MNDFYKFINTPLPYLYDALEPYIDEKTMHLHHDRHLQTYIDNLNKALEGTPTLQKLSLEQLLLAAPCLLPLGVGTTVANNAGGVYNHRFYFSGLAPTGTRLSGSLAYAIDDTYGSLDKFKDRFKTAALSVFGSGYAWLTTNKPGELKIITTANQNTPITQELCPVLCIDVWEHAYYLKHYNLRADYINDWWSVVNWETAVQCYDNRRSCFK